MIVPSISARSNNFNGVFKITKSKHLIVDNGKKTIELKNEYATYYPYLKEPEDEIKRNIDRYINQSCIMWESKNYIFKENYYCKRGNRLDIDGSGIEFDKSNCINISKSTSRM